MKDAVKIGVKKLAKCENNNKKKYILKYNGILTLSHKLAIGRRLAKLMQIKTIFLSIL